MKDLYGWQADNAADRLTRPLVREGGELVGTDWDTANARARPDGPRDPRSATAENPAGLTARQLEVLALMADGLTNAEIAERLVIAPRTTEHMSAPCSPSSASERGDPSAAVAAESVHPGRVIDRTLVTCVRRLQAGASVE